MSMVLDELTFSGPYAIAQLRYVTDEDGYHREIRNPGDDISDLPAEAQTAITAEWTPEVIAAYETALANQPQPQQPDAPEFKPADMPPSRAEFDALEARVTALESSATRASRKK